MNIAKKQRKGNSSFFLSNQAVIDIQYHRGCEILRSQMKASNSNSPPSSVQLSSSSTEFIMHDRVGQFKSMPLAHGNICILHDFASIDHNLEQQLLEYSILEDLGYQSISAQEFVALNSETTGQKQYLIKCNVQDVSLSILERAIKACNTHFLLPFSGTSIRCSLNVEQFGNQRINQIIRCLGKNRELRMHLLASLSSGECLVCLDKEEHIRVIV